MPSPAYRSGSSYQSGSTPVANVVLPKPSGVVSGDILIALAAFLYTVDTSTRTIAPPAGWTQLQHSNVALQGFYQSAITLFYKVADGSETDPMNFLLSGSDTANALGVMLAIQDASGIGASAKAELSLSNNVATPAIASPVGDVLDIRLPICMFTSSSTYLTPSTYTARVTVRNAYLGSPIGSFTKLQASSGTYPQVNVQIASLTGTQLGFSVLTRGPLETVDAATGASVLIVEHWDVHEGSGTIYTDAETGVFLVSGSSVDGMVYTDAATARLTLTPSMVEEYTRFDAGTAVLVFTPITEHECVTRFVLTIDVLDMKNRWSASNTFNKFNNATSRNKYYVTYVGVDPSVQDC